MKGAALAVSREIKSIYPGRFEKRLFSCLILSFSSRPSPQLSTLNDILAECKELADFPVMRKSTLSKGYKKAYIPSYIFLYTLKLYLLCPWKYLTNQNKN